MKYILWLLLVAVPMQSFAGSTEEKTRKLFEIQDVVSTYQTLIDQSRAQEQEASKKTINQVLSQLNPNKEFQDRFSQAGEKYTKALLTDRTAEQIVEVIIKYYAPKFSEQELDKLIDHYSSDLGKKDLAVSRASSEYMMQYYKAENEKIRIAATNDFINDLQLIAMQCNCAKRQPDKKKK